MALSLNTILPFTRNVVGPMDYTPVMFRDNVYPHLTTYAHELAQAVVYESGWIHFADGTKAYLELPEVARQFLKDVPAAWDDTKFIEGYPGKYIVIARRKGNQWFLGGLTGQDTTRKFNLDLSFLWHGHPGREFTGLKPVPQYKATVICDGAKPRTFRTYNQSLTITDKLKITLPKYGGFAAQLKP
jgi:alpha-glucosidase